MCKIQFIISSYFGSEVYQNEVNEYNFFGFSNFEQQIALMWPWFDYFSVRTFLKTTNVYYVLQILYYLSIRKVFVI